MDLSLEGRRAAVTGATTGIGAAVARRLAAEGADVAFCARDAAAVEELADELARTGVRVHGVAADLGAASGVADFCDAVDAAFGGVDVLVNNVGASPSRNFLYMSDDDWEQLFELNLLSAVRCTRRFLPGMREQRWGRVVMISSAAAKYPGAALIDYAATKAALNATATALARKYGADGVLTNCVLPGRIRTSMWERAASEIAEAGDVDVEQVFADRSGDIPVGRFGSAEEVADVVAFLASARSSYVNGAAIDVDGGLGGYTF